MFASAPLAAAQEPSEIEFFESKIRPILVEHCQSCHGEKKQEASLRLDSKAGWEKGGDQGRAIVPKKPKDSLLIKMVQGGSGKPPEMPPETVLSEAQIADLVKWIEMGAPDPRDGGVATAAKQIDWRAASKYWAFQPLAEAAPPAVTDPRFQQPIDRFLAAGLKTAGLKPVEPATRLALIRRVTFGLTGLPPTLAEAVAFVNDKSPDAYAKVVDRLLASPQYGEWQGRAWLDIARFAEGQTAEDDRDRKDNFAFRYRDWVISAFNDDMPYDKFVKYQIAADQIEGPAGVDYRHLPALGFIGLGPKAPRLADEWDDRVDTLTRGFLGLTVSCARCHDHKFDPIPTQDYYSLTGVIASTTRSTVMQVAPPETIAAYEQAKAVTSEKADVAKAFLQLESDRIALTKAEQIPALLIAAWRYYHSRLTKPDLKQEDYCRAEKLDHRALRGLDVYLSHSRGKEFPGAGWKDLLPKAGSPSEPPAEVAAFAAKVRDFVVAELAQPVKKRRYDMQKDLFGDNGAFPLKEADLIAAASTAWKADYDKLLADVKKATESMPPAPPQCYGVKDEVKDKVKDLNVFLRGNPDKKGPKAPRRFLRALAGEEAPLFTSGSGRLELAQAIADPKNPLTSTVIVNRLWQQHFGAGIVRTASNFGVLGSRPTHPELLDYLANQLIKQNWSLKRIHREIVLTATYQLASTLVPENVAKDPENQWLWRMPRRRLSVEEFRDSTLAVTGVLDRTMGGEGTDLDDIKNVRRTVYGRVSRYQLASLLRLFDFPDPFLTSERRNETTLPQQMLFLMNSPFVVERAKTLAARVSELPDPAAKVREAIALVFSRPATEGEIMLATQFLAGQDAAGEREGDGKNTLTRLERFTQMLLSSNEFFFVD